MFEVDLVFLGGVTDLLKLLLLVLLFLEEYDIISLEGEVRSKMGDSFRERPEERLGEGEEGFRE